ncbi:MAG: rod shape-determining protein MreD [Chloroflexota bacterium]|nr:rod shape-determining protein MreD [Chloroflexota bacterium]
MAFYLLLIVLGVAALLQVSFLPPLAINGVSANLMLVLVVGWTLLRGLREGVVWAVIGGLWLDLLSGGPFGLHTLGLLIAAYIASLGGGTIYRGNIFLPFIMIAITTLAQNAIQLLILWLTGAAQSVPDALLRLIFPQIGLNLLLMLILYPILARISRATGRERLPLE